MSNKPIFVATHPRACSTAFERVFMTRPESLQCIHEPFGDAFYYGPERLSSRFENNKNGRVDSGFEGSTYKTVLDRIEQEAAEGKRLIIKDMIYYLLPPNGAPASIAPSLARKERGVGTFKAAKDITQSGQVTPYPYATEAEARNPTIMPKDILERFHFTFLIRHPRYSVPSYYRCTVPPLDKVTGFYDFMPAEAGYDELRRTFDFLRCAGQIGSGVATGKAVEADVDSDGAVNGHINGIDICVIDADDLLNNPKGIVATFCKSVGIEYDDKMLLWESEEDHHESKEAFKKWPGFHDDAINSRGLLARDHKKPTKSNDEEMEEWREKFGSKGAEVIRETVDANVQDYEYLKQFALNVTKT